MICNYSTPAKKEQDFPNNYFLRQTKKRPVFAEKQGRMVSAPVCLARACEHILDENAIASGGVIHQNVRDGCHQFAVL